MLCFCCRNLWTLFWDASRYISKRGRLCSGFSFHDTHLSCLTGARPKAQSYPSTSLVCSASFAELFVCFHRIEWFFYVRFFSVEHFFVVNRPSWWNRFYKSNEVERFWVFLKSFNLSCSRTNSTKKCIVTPRETFWLQEIFFAKLTYSSTSDLKHLSQFCSFHLLYRHSPCIIPK